MSRSTQYIGLNKAAEEYIAKYVTLLPPAWIEEGTVGMFGEWVPLRSWKRDGGHKIYDEVVDIVPWSSGPMIFTCLQQRGTNVRLFRWRLDESLKEKHMEYDEVEGTYYV